MAKSSEPGPKLKTDNDRNYSSQDSVQGKYE
jgi:hypothetical protein